MPTKLSGAPRDAAPMNGVALGSTVESYDFGCGGLLGVANSRDNLCLPCSFDVHRDQPEATDLHSFHFTGGPQRNYRQGNPMNVGS